MNMTGVSERTVDAYLHQRYNLDVVVALHPPVHEQQHKSVSEHRLSMDVVHHCINDRPGKAMIFSGFGVIVTEID